MKRISLALSLFAFACTGPTTNNPKGGNATGIAVIDSDFKSTAISLLDAHGMKLRQDDCIDSGAVTPTLSIALSGDVSLASQPQPNGELVLVDRTNGALIWLDPATCKVTRELAVGTGFYSNPHDVISVSTTKAYVTRYETNATPSGSAGANDQGDDLLIINPSTLAITGRIDLSSYATTAAGVTLQARPDHALYVGGKVYVVLGNLSGDFKTSGPSRVVIVDPATDKVVGTIDPTGFANCAGIDYLASSHTLFLTCGGDFNSDPATQLAQSGVLLYDVSGAAPKLVKTIPASVLGRPLGNVFAAVSDELAVASIYGDFTGTPPDALYTIDLQAVSATKVADAAGSFVLGGAVIDAANHRVFVTNAEKGAPHVTVYDTSKAGSFPELTRFDANPKSGLPPGLIGWY
jgi:hypothetical protein